MRTWPLTGRSEELAFILAASASTDAPRGVVLAGAAGVGKTRLAREAVVVAERRGMTTRWVAATESARDVPFGAFSSVLSTVVADPTLVLRHATDELLAGGVVAGVIVAVDDAHLLDPLSALLLQRLVLRREATVLVTVRSNAPAPAAVTALWKDEHLDRLEVQALSENETGTLLATVLGGPVESASVRRMWDLTRGNALFLRQLVEGELEADRLHDALGVWRWTGDPVISPGLTELIVDRMGRLSGPVREVVDLLALGEPLGVSLLHQLADPAAVEDGETHGLLSIEHDGPRLRARLAHPLYGEVCRARLGRLRARRLRGRITLALADPAETSADALRRAVLSLDSDLAPDPRLLSAAARSAVQLVDFDLAERLARAAMGAGGGFEPGVILAYVLSFQSRVADAEAVLLELDEIASSDFERTLVANMMAATLLWPGRRPLEARAVIDRAEAIVSDDSCRRVLAGMRAAIHAGEGRASQAVELAIDTLTAANPPATAVMIATYALVAGLGVLGRADELAAAGDRGYMAAARSPELAFLRFGLASIHIGGLRLAGYVHEAAAVAFDRRRESFDMPGPAQPYGMTLAGQASLAQGRPQTALRLLREVRAALAPSDTQGFDFVCLLNMTEALALSGDPRSARQMCDKLEAERHPAFAYLEPELLLAGAWVTAAEGHIRRAVVLARQAAAEAVRLGQPAHEVVALHVAARLGDRTVADRLALLAANVDGPRAPAAAAHAAAVATGDGEGLRGASIRFEEMGDLLAAADAAAQAAAAFADCGRAGSATAAAARAQRLAEACEAARTPALIAAARPLPLTNREREIVTLAAQGLSSRDIATQLFISVRTVEGHLYNASAKLGTTSRSEFAAMLTGR